MPLNDVEESDALGRLRFEHECRLGVILWLRDTCHMYGGVLHRATENRYLPEELVATVKEVLPPLADTIRKAERLAEDLAKYMQEITELGA